MDDLLSTPHDRIIRPPTPLTSVPKIQEMRFSTRAGVTQHLDRIHVLHIQLDANGDRHEAEESTFASWVSTFDAYTSMLTRLRDITITLGRERFMWHKKCDSIWNDSSHEPQTMRFRVVLHALLFSLFKNSLSLSRIRFNADQLHLEVASTQFAHLLPDKHMNLAIESALNAHGHQEAFQDRELLQVMDNKVLRMGFCELRTITRSDGDVIEPRGHLRQWCDASHRFWPGGYSGWWEVKLRD